MGLGMAKPYAVVTKVNIFLNERKYKNSNYWSGICWASIS